ncbi:prephenate dehydratase [Nocardia zapadnayensis]|uniref:prephenate dehydratase n=1 Tax=Brevibacterium sp. R8603A2 TaxID=2929779 RepID=UPI001FF8DF95|nr:MULTISPECIES: prephenate dehydratase [Actinomycetes]MCK1803963.1 prephenate dehydratase [Brevibacterium sp. R8603A2]MCX0277386.1 prephenate dehydratase [Nocardia zapadnayensis]
MTAFGYLGPEATFTEAALIRLLDERGITDAERVPMHNAEAALAGLVRGELDGAVVPIENSLEGGVPATLDALTRNGKLQIVAETLVQVTFVLAVRPGTQLSDIRSFATHPHGEAQTRTWISEHLGNAHFLPASSTAAAARDLAAGDVEYQAAICPALAAERYGLEVLAAGIGDRADAITRFVLVRTPADLPAPTGADKTTIVAVLSSDRAGALLELLEQFAARGVNMSRIESRPTGDGLGLYQFSIDLQGHIAEARMAEALMGVHRVARRMQFLGSYPAAAGDTVIVDPRTTDTSFAEARAWLDTVLSTSRPEHSISEGS